MKEFFFLLLGVLSIVPAAALFLVLLKAFLALCMAGNRVVQMYWKPSGTRRPCHPFVLFWRELRKAFWAGLK